VAVVIPGDPGREYPLSLETVSPGPPLITGGVIPEAAVAPSPRLAADVDEEEASAAGGAPPVGGASLVSVWPWRRQRRQPGIQPRPEALHRRLQRPFQGA